MSLFTFRRGKSVPSRSDGLGTRSVDHLPNTFLPYFLTFSFNTRPQLQEHTVSGQLLPCNHCIYPVMVIDMPKSLIVKLKLPIAMSSQPVPPATPLPTKLTDCFSQSQLALALSIQKSKPEGTPTSGMCELDPVKAYLTQTQSTASSCPDIFKRACRLPKRI